MTSIVLVAPSATIVSLAEAKRHLRVEHDDDNERIEGLIWAAQNEFDGPDGTLARAIGVQQLELRLAAFPACEDIELPCPPLLRDDEHPLTINYLDDAGAETPVDPSLFSIVTSGKAGRARVALNYNSAWPPVRWQDGAVRVRYFCGYPAGDVRAEGIRSAIKLHVEMFYDGGDHDKTRRAIAACLQPYQLY